MIKRRIPQKITAKKVKPDVKRSIHGSKRLEKIRPKSVMPRKYFPTLYLILMSTFVIIVCILGIRQIYDTMTFQPEAEQELTLDALLEGFLKIEDQPGLALTPDQAKRILPLLTSLKNYMDIMLDFEKALSICLDDGQKNFIVRTSGKPFEVKGRRNLPPGKERISFIYTELSQFAGNAAPPSHLSVPTSCRLLEKMPSIGDACEGLYRLQKAGKLSQSQAAYLAPFLRVMIEAYGQIEAQEKEIIPQIKTILTSEQLNYIRKHEHHPSSDFKMKYFDELTMFLNERSRKLQKGG